MREQHSQIEEYGCPTDVRQERSRLYGARLKRLPRRDRVSISKEHRFYREEYPYRPRRHAGDGRDELPVNPYHPHRRRSHHRVRQAEDKREARALVQHGLVERRPLRVMHLAKFCTSSTNALTIEKASLYS